MTIFLTSAIWCNIFKSDFEKGIENLTPEDMKQLLIDQHDQFEKIKKDYTKLHIQYLKYYEYYQKDNKIPIFFKNIKFGLSTGISAYLNTDNVLKSNFDVLIQASFFYKYMQYSVGYQPLNKAVLITVGVCFP